MQRNRVNLRIAKDPIVSKKTDHGPCESVEEAVARGVVIQKIPRGVSGLDPKTITPKKETEMLRKKCIANGKKITGYRKPEHLKAVPTRY